MFCTSVHLFLAVFLPLIALTALLIPCLIYLLRLRRRRAVRFMSTYEDLHGARASLGDAPYADSLSDAHTDMASIPSASLVHLALDMGRARADSRATTRTTSRTNSRMGSSSSRGASPVDDPFADPDARAPLVAPSRRSPSSASAARPPSRWGASTSSRGAFSPVPTDAHHHQGLSVDLGAPLEWEGMDDPFADPNRRAVD